MEIAISNLAWKKSMDEKVFRLMHDLGISCIEISPFRDCRDVSEAQKQFSESILNVLSYYGIRIIAFQSLMFRHSEESIFKDETIRKKTFRHLVQVLKLAKELKVGVVVFGSPKTRIRGEMSEKEVSGVAKRFFKRLAEEAEKLSIIFCIEPTPMPYGSDFLCNTKEVISFIKEVNHKSLKINLDIGSSILNDENIGEIVRNNIGYIGHVHISEPYLKAVNRNTAFHENVAHNLNKNGYKGVVSIEMLGGNQLDFNVISKILSFVKSVYK